MALFVVLTMATKSVPALLYTIESGVELDMAFYPRASFPWQLFSSKSTPDAMQPTPPTSGMLASGGSGKSLGLKHGMQLMENVPMFCNFERISN